MSERASRQELLELLEYVRGAHEFCERPHRCATCDSLSNAECRYHPKRPRCEGCAVYERISAICEYEGLA